MNDLEKIKALAAKHSEPKTTDSLRIRNQADSDYFFSEKWCPSFCSEAFERSILSNGCIMYKLLDGCIFDRNHKDASVIIRPDGSFGYNCFHDSCSNMHWSDFREYFEPGYRERQRAWERKKENAK